MRRSGNRLAAWILIGLFAFGCGVPAASAQSVTYKIVVPFAPGGGQDVLARLIAPELSKLMGQTFIIENRAGAGGAVGGAAVARSAPDGATLLMAASSHTISAAIDRKLAFDPIKDFTAVAHIGTGAYIVLVNAKVPAKSVAEFITYAKANPGVLNYSSAGVGSATHLAMAYFASSADFKIVHVPFKSTAEALNSLTVGDTHILIVPTLGSQAYVSNPAIRVLAVVSKTRLPSLPDIPTVEESGLPGYDFSSWFGLLGPANMPAGIIAKINDSMAQIIAMPAIASKIEVQGVSPKTMTSAEFGKALAANFTTIKSIVSSAGLGAD